MDAINPPGALMGPVDEGNVRTNVPDHGHQSTSSPLPGAFTSPTAPLMILVLRSAK